MPNPGDFDPAEAIQGLRQAEEDEEQQRDLYRANILKLLRYADEQLENIRNPVVSEFVVTERWWTTERISGKGAPQLRAGQRIVATEEIGSFFRPRAIFTVRTEDERRTRYFGSWLSLDCTRDDTSASSSYRRGLMKLRRPAAGYAYLQITGWDPRTVGHLTSEQSDYTGQNPYILHGGDLSIYGSLEEAAERAHPYPSGYVEHHTQGITKSVKKALDFVATGRPPEPFIHWETRDYD